MKKIYNAFLLIILLLVLTSCQKSETKNQNTTIQKCLSWNDIEAHQNFYYLDKQFNSTEESGWHKNKGEGATISLSEWSDENAKRIVLENTSPSGDWYSIDEYCFNGNGGIAELYSDLRTFYGNVQVIRKWKYYADSSVENYDIQTIDMNTKKTINPDEANYMDNPPYLVKTYKDLADHFHFPDLGL
jgi:hypothetical protein